MEPRIVSQEGFTVVGMLVRGKNDQGEYVDEKDRLAVRVSLGLKPRFERTLFWSPKRRFAGRAPLIVAAEEGVYVYEGEGVDHLRLFDTIEPPRQIFLDLLTSVGQASEVILRLIRVECAADLLDAFALGIEVDLTDLDVLAEAGDLDLLLGDQADVGLHLRNDLIDHVPRPAELEFDRHLLLSGLPTALPLRRHLHQRARAKARRDHQRFVAADPTGSPAHLPITELGARLGTRELRGVQERARHGIA